MYVSMRYWEDINRWGVWGDKPLWGGGESLSSPQKDASSQKGHRHCLWHDGCRAMHDGVGLWYDGCKAMHDGGRPLV